MSEIYEYANSFNELGVVCQFYEVKNIINDKKEIFEHKQMIFFTEYDFKRIFSSEHILIDATYIFPVGFSETIIIMYYDIIIFKFIPAIYILINNKTKVGYTHIFKDLYEYINNYEKEIKNKLNWKSWTSDFEIALINSFNEVFEEYNIEHHGCFFHFMKNCYKKLRSKGYASVDKKEQLKILLKFTISLPFKRNININYKKEIKNLSRDKDEFNFYNEYLIDTWGEHFKSGSLNLVNVKKIFRTNNALENYNRIFKNLINMKSHMQFSIYIDNIIKEFQNNKIKIEESENKLKKS